MPPNNAHKSAPPTIPRCMSLELLGQSPQFARKHQQ